MFEMEENQMMSAKNISLGGSRFIKDNGPKFIDDQTSEMVHIDSLDGRKNKKHLLYLTERGHMMRKGAWSKEETALLIKNFDTYVKNNNIDDPLRLLCTKSDRKMKEIIKRTCFRSVVCRNLNRCTPRIYKKLKYNLMCKGTGGKFTDQEDKHLTDLVKKHDRNFVKIASILNRNYFNVFNRYIVNKKRNCNKGHWSQKEENQLFHGLKTVMRTNDIESLRQRSDIRWMEISKFVKTRNYQQCRKHFRTIKKFKLQSSLSISQPWTKEHTVLLINNLYDINCDDENDIDWIELNQLFTDVSPSSSYLQHRFACLKYKIEDYNRKSFEEIVEALREKHCNN